MTLPQELKELSSSRTALLVLATSKVGNLLRQQIAEGNNVVMVLLSFVGIMKRQVCCYCLWGRSCGRDTTTSEKVISVNSSNCLLFIRQSSLIRYDFPSFQWQQKQQSYLSGASSFFYFTPFLSFFSCPSHNRNIPTLLTDGRGKVHFPPHCQELWFLPLFPFRVLCCNSRE